MMNYLLDTHALIWFMLDSPSMSPTAKEILMNGKNRRFISIASVWEMAIKVQIGKLKFDEPYSSFLPKQMERHQVSVLQITTAHAVGASELPFALFENGQEHRDPFDRIIVLQSKLEAIPLISNEEIFDKYGISRVW